jgi:hypothetical protein
MDTSSAPATVTTGGRRRSGVSVKTLKRALKKAGLKVSGKKATLTRRAKKARLMGGADEEEVVDEVEGGRRRRSRKSKGFRLY